MQRRAFSILTAGIALSVLGAMGGPALASSSIPASPPKAAAAPAASVPVTDPWANLVEEPLGTFPTDPSATKWAPTPEAPSDINEYPPGTTAPSGAIAGGRVSPSVHPRTLTVTVSGTADQDIYTLTPDVLGTVTSSAGGTVQGFFYVRDHGSATWNLANAAEVDVASGTVASWRFADQMGTSGGLYDWQMKACQSSTCSALTSIVTFEINPMVGSGDRGYFQYLDAPLSSAATAHVNYANGNLAVDWSDLSIAGVDGLNLGFTRTYNSITDETIAMSDFGSHWTNALTDPFTAVQSSGGIRLQGPSGYLAEFSKRGTNYISPSGLDADVQLTGGSTTTMTFHHDADGYQQGEQLIFIGDYLHTIKDKHGNTLSLSYYTGAPEVKTITDNQTGRSITMSNYNAAGQAQTVTDSTGRVLTYTYDSSGNLATFADAGEGTITGDATTQYSYDSAHELTQITDPAGIITKIGYTANKVSSLTRGYGTSDQQTTDFTYYPVGDSHCSGDPTSGFACTVVVQDRSTEPPTSGDGTYAATTYWYDKSDRVVYVVDADTNPQQKTWDVNSNVLIQSDKISTANTTTTVYDIHGLNNPTSAVDATLATSTLGYTGSGHPYQPDNQNLPNNESNTTAAKISYAYTAASGSSTYGDVTQAAQGSTTLKSSFQGDGATTCSAQPGELCTTTNGKSGVTSYGYNSSGDLTSVTPPTPLAVVHYTPDALGRLSTSKDGLGQTTTVHYDVLDRVTEVDYPASSKTMKYTHDGDGNVTEVQAITGTTATYTLTYDNLNRLKHVTGPANNTGITDDAYTYDLLGNLTQLHEYSSTATTSLTTNYTYNLVNDTLTAAATAEDAAGHSTSIPTVTFTPDANGQVTGITLGSSESRTILYDKAGREVESKASGSGTLTNQVYCYINPVSSCPSTSTPNVYPAPGAFVVTNNKQTAIDTVAGTTLSYTYDALNRLTDANTTAGGTDHRSYGYDADGNRTSETINGTNTTYTFNSADQATTTGYSFDADGNGTATPTLSNLTYNPLNQTTGITKSGTTTNFTYAGPTQDTRTTANSIDAALSSLGTDVEESSGPVYHFYVRDPAGDLLAIVNDNAGTLTTRYPILDGTGSAIALTNGAGTIDDTWKYDPYGNVITHTGTDYNPFQYTSSYTDSATGLVQDGARYYNPADGRFTQQDPASQGPNLYAYSGANPINFVDTSGLGGVVSNFAQGCTDGLVQTTAFAVATTVVSGGTAIELTGGELVTSCLIGGLSNAIGGTFGEIANTIGTASDVGKFLGSLF